MGIDIGAGEPARFPPPNRGLAPERTGAGTGGQARARFSPVTALVAIIPGVLGLVTGGYHLGVPPIWGDEGVTKEMAARPVSALLATMPHDDVVHGAYYLVVHVVEAIAGGSGSPTVLRLPSVLAMAVAAAFTALVAQRLATLARSPYPYVTGLVAGLLFALLPAVIRYAQEARSYAIVTMLAAVTTYLLLEAVCEGGRWWLGYAAAAALTGLFNIFGLLLLLAHGVTILIAARGRVRWLLAGAGAVAVLIPIVAFAYTQRNALAWMSGRPPIRGPAVNLANFWAGSPHLVWPVFGLVAVGAVADAAVSWRRRLPLTPGSVALPWLVVPPAVLLVASQAHPVYDVRYVEYCLPALAIGVAWGLTWLARAVAGLLPPRQRGLGWLGWLLPVAIMVPLVAALLPLGAKMRLPSSRADNLALDSQIVAANARPGDIVFFIPISYRPVEVEYPAQWRDVRDIAQAVSPLASDTLYGTDVSPAELLERFTDVTRVWVYTSPAMSSYVISGNATPVDREEAFLVSRMKLVRQWRDGDKMLRLYQVR